MTGVLVERSELPAARMSRARNVLIAIASVIVIGLTGTYLLAPERYAFGVSRVTATKITTNEIVLWGRALDVDGHGRRGAVVTVYEQEKIHGKRQFVRIWRTTTDSAGRYRVPLARRPDGTYRVEFAAWIGNGRRVVGTNFTAANEHAYWITARITKRFVFSLFPVSTY